VVVSGRVSGIHEPRNSNAAYRDCRLKVGLASAKLGWRWLVLLMRKLPANLELLLYLEK